MVSTPNSPGAQPPDRPRRRPWKQGQDAPVPPGGYSNGLGGLHDQLERQRNTPSPPSNPDEKINMPGPTGPKIGQAQGRKPGDDEIMEKLRAIAGETMRPWPDRRDE